MSEQYEHAIILNVNIGSMTLSRGQWTKQITSFHSSWKVENFGLWYTKAERILKEREVEICEELLQQKIESEDWFDYYPQVVARKTYRSIYPEWLTVQRTADIQEGLTTPSISNVLLNAGQLESVDEIVVGISE